MDDSRMPDTYDRLLGSMDGLPGMTSTKPATIEQVTPLLGTSQTFIVRTFRHQHQAEDGEKSAPPAAFTVFLKYIEGTQAIKIAIPPRVCELIARQREALTTQARKRQARTAAATRKARGYKPTFGRKR